MQTRRVTSKTRDLWRRMRSTGVPLPDELPLDPPGLRIEQFGGVEESRIFVLPGGSGIGYIMWLRVVPIRPGIQIERWEPKRDHPDLHFQWLQPSGERHDYYCFPHGPEYPPEDVLNHHVECTLQRPMRGALLAFGGRPIPEQYPHGSVMELEVSAIDQHDQSYPVQVKLWVDRFAERSFKPTSKPTRSLFERPTAPSLVAPPPTRVEGDSKPGRCDVNVTPRDTRKLGGGKPTQMTSSSARILE